MASSKPHALETQPKAEVSAAASRVRATPASMEAMAMHQLLESNGLGKLRGVAVHLAMTLQALNCSHVQAWQLDLTWLGPPQCSCPSKQVQGHRRGMLVLLASLAILPLEPHFPPCLSHA